jgi:mono/diheme cytochrome c family protein
MMNTILRATAVLVVTCAACAAGFAQGAQQPAGDSARGKQLYTTIGCSYCHGTAGQGGGGRAGGLRLAQMGIAYPAFLNQLRQPQDEMPPYVASVLPDKDVADIYAFVSSLPPPPDAKSIPILNP